MFRIRVALAAALIAFTASVSLATAAAAQTTGTVTVSGRVRTSDGKPVSDARVYVPGSNEATRTDARGNYSLAGVPAGPQVVVVRKSGYAPVRTEAKFSTKPSDRARNNVDVTLLTSDQAATELAQSARDSAALDKVGFFKRESSVRGGYFITPDQIDQQKAVRLSDIVRQVPVLVESVGRTGPVLRGVRGCLITYVDGFPWRSMFPGDLDSYVSARDVVAVEAYGPGLAPPTPFVRGAFRANCTTLGLWTRSGMG
jgi:Carboxypeptidase regulatory-like domain